MPEASGVTKYSPARRWLVRAWFRLQRRKTRLLPEATWEKGPTVLAVAHAPTWIEALRVATAFPHPIRFFFAPDQLPGAWARFLARGVGMIPFEAQGPAAEAAARAGAEVLLRGETVALFVDDVTAPETALAKLAAAAASLTQQAEAGLSGLRVTLHPVHLLLPSPPSKAREGVIYVEPALPRRSAPGRSGRAPGPGEPTLAPNLETVLRQNAFQLQPADVDNFLQDLESLLRESLDEDWSTYENWKQDTSGFSLSRYAVKWVREANYLHPAKLIGLREALDDYRSQLQQIALLQGELKTTAAWTQSGPRAALVWVESLLGLPVALFGALNHLVPGAVLFLAGSFKKENVRKRSTEWAIRGAVLLACYIVQIFLVAHWRGRSAAGYYVPALLLTGLYVLLRYWWLLRRRTGPLIQSVRLPALTRKAHEQRQSFLRELDRALSFRVEAPPIQNSNLGRSSPAGAA